MTKSAVRGSIVRLCLALALLAICAASTKVFASPCPRTQRSITWINQSIDLLVRSAYAAYVSESAQTRHQRIVDSIAGTIQRCQLANDAELSQSYPEFFAYVKLLSIGGRDDHELGFEVSDKDYFAETGKFTTIPDFLLTQNFLRLVSGWESLPQAKSFLRDFNQTRTREDQLLFFSYASRHLGTPDNPDSYRRLLIVVPGDRARGVPEKWVQFGIADPRKARTVRNVSVVAVVRNPDDTANVYFKDYYRTYRKNGSIAIKGRWELGESDDPCVTCHKSGVLPIFPVAGTVSHNEQETLEAVNARFRGYGVTRFGRYIDATKFGPGLGSSTAGAQRMSLSNRFNTRACTLCHSANGLGSLNWPMDSTIIKSFVTGGQMPLNADLPRTARNQLYRQLVADYFGDKTQPGILRDWLLGKMRSVRSDDAELTTTP